MQASKEKVHYEKSDCEIHVNIGTLLISVKKNIVNNWISKSEITNLALQCW